MKTKNYSSIKNLTHSNRAKINPIKNLTPQSLTRILDQFHRGNLAPAAITWDAIERRDDVIQGVASKRKKSIAHLPWQIITLDDSPEALRHKKSLEFFYNNLTATHATDTNIQGGFSLLIKQMLDAVGKKYAVHEITYQPFNNTKDIPQLTASFKFVPLQFFENSTGQLRFTQTGSTHDSAPLEDGSWLTTSADGLMESSSIAYLFKHLPLRDWLVYCERNGMPGVKGITDAQPGSQQWNAALDAVADFSSEFHALMSRGTDILPIDLTASGNLPYPQLIERMDRALIALWRGCDLSTLSSANATGASVQAYESALIEHDDAAIVSETLNAQVDRYVLKYLFGVERGKAYIKLQPNHSPQIHNDLIVYEKLASIGLPLPKNHLLERFGIPQENK